MDRNFKIKGLSLGLSLLLAGSVGSALAKTYSLDEGNLIGNIGYASTSAGDTVASVAKRYDLGVNQITAANPDVAPGGAIASGKHLSLPTKFLLPSVGKKGIVINLPEMRLYYYPEGTNTVMTFPIGIGRVGKTIPLATSAAVTTKKVNPTWIPPQDIREFNRSQGIELPKSMGPGPDNPLGPYAIYLSIPTYLIHSTIFPESIGKRASFGCIRMNESDIKEFFPLVKPGTRVVIIDVPNKVAWQNNKLYLETHRPLEERSAQHTLNNTVNNLNRSIPKGHVVLVNWQMVSYLSQHPDGMPHAVGVRVN